MRRREFVTLIGGAAVAWPLAVRAQQPAKVARVGFFRQAGPHDKQFNAFRDGLRAAGYVEGKNVLIEQRYAAGVYERLSGLAAELVRSNVDIIVVDGTAAAKACKDATATIPVVFALGLDLRAFDVRGPNDLPGVFAAMADWHADGLVTLADGMFFTQRDRVVELTLKGKLPAVYPEAEFVAAGGLASYGPSLPDLFRRAASYVDKILKGAKPADLPIEQPSKFELVVNLKTA